MAYRKILVDNLSCLRRFHLATDDSLPVEDKVAVQCPHCHVVVFEQKKHPPVRFLRDENLIQIIDASPQQTTECHFVDKK